MRLMHCRGAAELEAVEPGAVLCHDVRDPSQARSVVVRKGRHLDETDLIRLQQLGANELHLLVPEPGDLSEDDAAARIAAAVAGPGVCLSAPHNGQVNLTSEKRGWLRVHQGGLQRVNTIEGVLLFTSLGERVADEGDVVGGVKCAPLLLPGAALTGVETYCSEAGPLVEVEPFPARAVALVALDRLGEATIARAGSVLGANVTWFGSRLEPVLSVPSTDGAVAEAFRQAVAREAFAILVAGASATDPADVAFEGLRRAGGRVNQIGIPIEPGTACWTGQIDGRQVLGLATCELFGRPGAVDLLLPRLLLGEALDRALLARLAGEGLVASLPVHRPLS